jgi:hypothetical protein
MRTGTTATADLQPQSVSCACTDSDQAPPPCAVLSAITAASNRPDPRLRSSTHPRPSGRVLGQEGDVGAQALADESFGDDARVRSGSLLPGSACALLGRRGTSGLSRAKDKRRQPAAVVTPHRLWMSVRQTSRIAAQLPRGGPVSRTPSPSYLNGAVGGSTARRSRLGDSVSDRSAVL